MFIYAGTGSSSVTDSVDVFLTALTTTTTTTTTLAVATAADALAAIEDQGLGLAAHINGHKC